MSTYSFTKFVYDVHFALEETVPAVKGVTILHATRKHYPATPNSSVRTESMYRWDVLVNCSTRKGDYLVRLRRERTGDNVRFICHEAPLVDGGIDREILDDCLIGSVRMRGWDDHHEIHKALCTCVEYAG
jgi:hypothetical protein